MLDIKNLRTPLIGPVSFSVSEGECVAILGPSGSGKSLLLRAVADLDPNEGEVRLGTRERDRMPANIWRQAVALVPAESGWWTDRVADHFDPDHEAGPMLAAVGLPEAMGWQVSRLSTGERHRLAIVRALCRAPKGILLDEPTAALDDEATAAIEALITEQCRQGAAVILVTHDRDQAQRLAARRLLMERGQLRPEAEAAA
ncbi:MAG TPA: ABC transporter ATP-binding protein [Thermohalobaculum sp.]|nr:ABC transporter ATP-binding protein [Thermohalobaculum sp.]